MFCLDGWIGGGVGYKTRMVAHGESAPGSLRSYRGIRKSFPYIACRIRSREIVSCIYLLF